MALECSNWYTVVMSKKGKRPQKKQSICRRVCGWFLGRRNNLVDRYKKFLARRPHRSFRRTYRRDYVRSLKLPGYVAFTRQVLRTLRIHKRTFLLLVILYAAILILIGGITSQETYSQINTLLKDSGKDLFSGGMGKVGEAGLLAVSAFLTGSSDLSVDQQIYLGITLLFVWLSTVWLLREFLLKRKPRLRDGLYNSGSPVIATVVVLFVLTIQLVPVGLVALMYAGLTSVGLAQNGFGSMLFWLFAIVVAVLVFYWATSTLIALVVVTLPGMYPLRALKASSDLVIGRRLRILYRWLWAALIIILAWVIVMIPVILLDTVIKSALPAIQNVPIVPYVGAFMSSATVVWFASYVYLLYRRIVDDDARPA